MLSWENSVEWLRLQKDKQDLVRACYFDDPLLNSAQRFYNSAEWKETKRIINIIRPGKALDLGAGRGISSYALARDGWDVIAVEPGEGEIVGTGAIKEIVNAESNISIVESIGEFLPFKDKTFDLVYARQALHHSENINAFCREAYRVLNSGGIFLSVREHIISKKSDLPIFFKNHPLHHLYGGENAYKLRQYKNAFKNAGFNKIEIIKTYSSNINLFPSSKEELIKRYCLKLKMDIPKFLLNKIILLLNLKNNTPGRLFSFICRK